MIATFHFIIFFTAHCTAVTCSFTIDNVVDSATYDGITLAITGDENLANWVEEKAVTFESCYDSSPGTLVIKGSDNDAGGTYFNAYFFISKGEIPGDIPEWGQIGSNPSIDCSDRTKLNLND